MQEVIAIEGNGARPSHQGPGYSIGGVMFSLNTTEVHAVAYRICSYDSNAMKSPNPNSGFYQTDISNTLDQVSCGNPTCNQGGIVIVQRSFV